MVPASQRQKPESTFSEHLLCAVNLPRSHLNFWLSLPKAGVICRGRRCGWERGAAHAGHLGDEGITTTATANASEPRCWAWHHQELSPGASTLNPHTDAPGGITVPTAQTGKLRLAGQ